MFILARQPAVSVQPKRNAQPEMCGNGIRCMARFLADLEGKKAAEYKIHTLAGTIIPVVS